MKTLSYIIIPLILILGCGTPLWRSDRPIYRAPQKEQTSYFIVSTDDANVRSGPGTTFEVIDKANEGDRYTILEAVEPTGKGSSWYRVRIDNFREGWISGLVGGVEGKVPQVDNVFNGSADEVSTALLEALQWMKWQPAFVDKEQGMIRLKEAYVFRQSGKLRRVYYWPPVGVAKQSSIDDYLEKIAYYENDFFNAERAVLSQETMEVEIISLSNSQTKVVIDYRIKPYLESGKFGEQIRSKGYIESLLLDRIHENLGDKVSIRENGEHGNL
ncbi:MAG TPA: SH3 domain-containing protein [Thermodesulfobacteriota bacterium]|nr:SH3 domain-containing protein [Thermodesulfobacteriota bacterium]